MLTRRTFLGRTLTGTAVLLAAPAVLRRPAWAGAELDSVQALIDAAAADARAKNGAQLALCVGVVGPESPNGRLLFAGGNGLVSPTGAPVTLSGTTPFEIGSISKVFTSAIHYRTHGTYAGTLGGTIGSAVKLSPAVAALELRNLATYQPGLPQDTRSGAYPAGTAGSLDSVFAYLNGLQGPLPQGTCYAYSNLGWGLLAMASVGLAGTDTQAFVARYERELTAFCGTFGAKSTHVFSPTYKPLLPTAYAQEWRALPGNGAYAPTRPPLVGSGGIVSTGADMLAFLSYNMGHRAGGLTDQALSYEQSATFKAPSCRGGGNSPATAYGWFRQPVRTTDGPVTVLNKNGGVPGFTSWMGFTAWQGTGAPSKRGVFVLANGPVATELGTTAIRILLSA